ncbi:MAG: ABC transporter ATP-binding protein [Flavobacteriaceae bacterium]|nr:ABC transporter ATP-binding protein [Flavobacteriaceae bacterium]
MTYFKKILRYALPYKMYGILNIFFNILYSLFSALSMLALLPMLKVLFNKDEDKFYPNPIYNGISSAKEYFQDSLNCYVVESIKQEGHIQILTYMIILIISLFMLKNFFNYLAMFFMTYLRNGVLKDLRNDVYQKTIELPLSYFSEKRKGDIIARIGTDVLEIQYSFLSVLEMLVREPLTILFTLIAMIFLSIDLTIFVFIFIPISGFLISLVGKKLKRQSENVQKEQGTFLSILDETLSGLRVIKGFNAEAFFQNKFEDSTNRFYKFLVNLINRKNLASPMSEFLGICVIAVLLWYGGNLVFVKKVLEPETFIIYIGLAYNILTPAKAISKASYSVKKGNAAAERVLELLEMESPLKDKPTAEEKNSFDQAITLENISFKYENDYVLKNFTLAIPKGKTVALVGQSGSGKSTIANLLTRFYDVNEGAIKIDGIDIKNIKKHSLRNLMGLVTQDSILFNDTIANNIKLGKQEATYEEVLEASKVANAFEFIKEQPEGFDTNIGDGGGKLSGGQKQRLSIARAVLKDPPIMILDEATSALDTESEKLVQIALENMTKNRTSVVIAHRLSTIQNADVIVVMQKGKIVEQGTHQELIDNKGTYYKLVEMQSFD